MVKNCLGNLCRRGYPVFRGCCPCRLHYRLCSCYGIGREREDACGLREAGRKNEAFIGFSVRRCDEIARRLKVIRGVLFVTRGGTTEVSGRQKSFFMPRVPKAGNGERQPSHNKTPIRPKENDMSICSSKRHSQTT